MSVTGSGLDGDWGWGWAVLKSCHRVSGAKENLCVATLVDFFGKTKRKVSRFFVQSQFLPVFLSTTRKKVNSAWNWKAEIAAHFVFFEAYKLGLVFGQKTGSKYSQPANTKEIEFHSCPKVLSAKNCRPCGLSWPSFLALSPPKKTNYNVKLSLGFVSIFWHTKKGALLFKLLPLKTANMLRERAKKNIYINSRLTCCRFKLFMGQLVGSKASQKPKTWQNSELGYPVYWFVSQSGKSFTHSNPWIVGEIWTRTCRVFCVNSNSYPVDPVPRCLHYSAASVNGIWK